MRRCTALRQAHAQGAEGGERLRRDVAAHVRARPDEEDRPADPERQHDLPAQRQVQPGIDAHAQRQVACAARARVRPRRDQAQLGRSAPGLTYD